jgi:hypothetical protein
MLDAVVEAVRRENPGVDLEAVGRQSREEHSGDEGEGQATRPGLLGDRQGAIGRAQLRPTETRSAAAVKDVGGDGGGMRTTEGEADGKAAPRNGKAGGRGELRGVTTYPRGMVWSKSLKDLAVDAEAEEKRTGTSWLSAEEGVMRVCLSTIFSLISASLSRFPCPLPLPRPCPFHSSMRP